MPSSTIASVCFDYTNMNTIYIGKGDPRNYSATKAVGVWKSKDGVNIFIQMNTGMGNGLVFDIVISPADHNVLVAATNIGIYKSMNGSFSWTRQSAVVNLPGFSHHTAPGSQGLFFQRGYCGSTGEFYRSADFGSGWTQIILLTPRPTLAYRGGEGECYCCKQ